MDSLFDLESQRQRLSQRHNRTDTATADEAPTLPSLSAIEAAESTLPDPSSADYLSGQKQEDVVRHITEDIVPALNGQGRSARYYGFVTGGVLPVAEWADNVVTRMDQNVQVHLPKQTIATTLEDTALEMLVHLLRLDDERGWKGRTFTTGATACNVLGLACGRETVVNQKLSQQGQQGDGTTVGELGLLAAGAKAGLTDIQVLTSAGHSSLSKAASVVGLGRGSVKELQQSEDEPWKLDLEAVEKALQKPATASIIAISAADVNAGGFALEGRSEWQRLRSLANQHGAWIHVDGAFGIFARALDNSDEYRFLHEKLDGIELADSITVDGHKILNVPYDCGMFFTRSSATLQSVFVNPNAAYLSSGNLSTIPSPLNIGLENSRRFRALPAYTVLLSEGKPGLAELVGNMVQLSRQIAGFLRDSPHYELLPNENSSPDQIFMTVLFRAKVTELNETLVDKINETRQMYVSGTSWKGKKAVRIAVSNWKVNVERDAKVVTAILAAIAKGEEFDISRY